jgi:hypothetical protein
MTNCLKPFAITFAGIVLDYKMAIAVRKYVFIRKSALICKIYVFTDVSYSLQLRSGFLQLTKIHSTLKDPIMSYCQIVVSGLPNSYLHNLISGIKGILQD